MINQKCEKENKAADKEKDLVRFPQRGVHKRISGGSKSRKRSFIFKHGVKSKSLDIFDRPEMAGEREKTPLKRYRSLASIPEHSVQVELSNIIPAKVGFIFRLRTARMILLCITGPLSAWLTATGLCKNVKVNKHKWSHSSFYWGNWAILPSPADKNYHFSSKLLLLDFSGVKYREDPLLILETSSELKNATGKQQLSSSQYNQREKCSRNEGVISSSNPLEMTLKITLLLFLIMLLAYHIYHITIKTENVEPETCDTDNQSNNLFIYWQLEDFRTRDRTMSNVHVSNYRYINLYGFVFGVAKPSQEASDLWPFMKVMLDVENNFPV